MRFYRGQSRQPFVTGWVGVEFEDRGEQEMKGVGEPVRVYVVRAQA
jgi:class 3 adenylate cyclase